MPEPKSREFAPPWRVPVTVEEVAESGQHFDLIADVRDRAAVAKAVGLRDLPRFEASFDVARRGSGGLHVTGSISATVGQNCVVTLEPLANEVEETIDLIFEPPELVPKTAAHPEGRRHGVLEHLHEFLVRHHSLFVASFDELFLHGESLPLIDGVIELCETVRHLGSRDDELGAQCEIGVLGIDLR